MKAIELIRIINEGAFVPEVTCDTVKCGDPEKTIKKVGVTMFATIEVLKKAKDWGADMLIVHEPTYYDHMDVIKNDPVITAKKEIVDNSDILIYRYHDHMHYRQADLISHGQAKYLGLSGKISATSFFGSSMLESDTPVSARELVMRMKNELGIPHVRVAGELDKKYTKIALCFGTPGGVADLLRDEAEIVLTGEASEWRLAEYARDAALLGMDKALIVIGHIGSEAGGMIVLSQDLAQKYPELEVKYFESGAVYHDI